MPHHDLASILTLHTPVQIPIADIRHSHQPWARYLVARDNLDPDLLTNPRPPTPFLAQAVSDPTETPSFLEPSDFRIGSTITLNGLAFTIIDCDPFTRTWQPDQPAPLPCPVGEYVKPPMEVPPRAPPQGKGLHGASPLLLAPTCLARQLEGHRLK